MISAITPVGDTTAREISAASQEVHEILERLPGVARIEPQRVPAPDHAKGALVDALGGLALSVAPAVLKAVLQTLQTVLSRQPQSTKVLIQTKDDQTQRCDPPAGAVPLLIRRSQIHKSLQEVLPA